MLTGEEKTLSRDTLYWHYPHYHRTNPYGAIRQGKWKLIEFFEDGSLELYDLEADPNETRDLAASESGKASELLSNLKQWRVAVDAQMPTPNPAYDPKAGKKSRKNKE